jgi:hypothetical protein
LPRYRHLWALCLCSCIHECRKTSIFTASSAPAFIDEGVPKGSGFGTPHSGEPFRKQAVDSANAIHFPPLHHRPRDTFGSDYRFSLDVPKGNGFGTPDY